MIRRGFGVFLTCIAALVLASCSSSTAPSGDDRLTLTGVWGGSVVGGPARSYSVTFNDSSIELVSTSYAGPYFLNGEQNGLGFAQGRIPRNSRSVVIDFDTTPFRGSFTEADTIMGKITIASHDYPLTLTRARQEWTTAENRRDAEYR